MKRTHGFTLLVPAVSLILIFSSSAMSQTASPSTSSPVIDMIASGDQSSANSSVSTNPFSTPQSNELLLAFVSTDSSLAASNTVTSISGAGLNWEFVTRANNALGDAEIWRAFTPSPLSNVTVSAALQQTAAASITVIAFSGVDTSGTNGSGAVGASGSFSAASGAPSGSLVTTRNKSWVFAVGNDWDNAINRTTGPNQTLLHQYLATVGDTYWVQAQNTVSSSAGTTVTMNDTAPSTDQFNLALIEVLPAASPIPDFSVSAAPSSQSIAAGSSASYTVSIAAQNGFSGTTDLTVSGLPSGVAASFSPTSISGSGSAQLTVSTSGSSAAGTYPLSITGTSGTLSHTTNVSLAITASPDFTVAVTPATQSVQPGATTTFTTTITAQNGYTAATDISVSGLPTEATTTLNPAAVSGSGTSQISISTSSALAAGTYPFSVTATGGGVTHSANATLVVSTPSPSTQLQIDTVSSGNRSTAQTSISTGTFSTAQAGELLLAFVSTDSSATSGNSVTSVTGGGVNWQLVTRANQQAGDAEIWKAFAPSLLSSVSVKAAFSQSAAASITVIAFTGADMATGVGASGSFSAASGAPTGTVATTRDNSWVFAVGNDWDNAVSRSVGANQTMVHQYLASVGDTYWVQRHKAITLSTGTTVTMNDTAPSTDRYNFAVVEVLPAQAAAGIQPDFSISATPASQSVQAGSTTTYTVNISGQTGYQGTANFTVSGLPVGAIGMFSPTSVNGTGTSQLSISTTGSTPLGSYPVTITATSGSLVHTSSVTLTVTGVPDFSVSATPSTQSVQAGSSASYSVNISGQSGYSGTANLSVSGLPIGAIGTFSPTSVNGTGTSQLSISTTGSTTPGSYPLTITATSGSLVHASSVTLNIGSAPDFTLSATPSTQSVQAGASTSYAVNIAGQNGYSATTTLTISGLPAGATGTFSPSSLIGTGVSQLNVTTASSMAVGSYPLTITAASGTLVHTLAITLTVTAPANFTLSTTPSSQSVQPGSNTTYSIAITALNGYSGSANLTVSGLPTGASATFSPASITGSGNSQLTVTAATTTLVGNYPLTVTATAGALTHTSIVTLAIVAVPDFTLSISPSILSVAAGSRATYTATISALNGYSATATFSVAGLPTGATGTFSSTSVSGSGTSQLTIATTASTVAGTYPLSITLTAGTLTHSITASLVVTMQHSVSLSWVDGDSGIAGYNIYRGAQNGGPYTKVNTSLIPTTNWTDNTVQPGQTYVYVVTAVSALGAESGYSTQATAVIPNP